MRSASVLYYSAFFLSLFAAPASAVELITNGGFELGTFNDTNNDHYDVIPTENSAQDLTGWTVGNSLAWGVNTIDINPHAGNGFVDLTGVGDTNPHGILNQTISTIIGQQYTFSIFLTQDFTSAVGIDVFADSVALVLSGTPGFWGDNTGLDATYGQMTGVFTATHTSTPIRIQSILFGSTVFMIGLDDVSVTGPDVVGTTPIPGALPLFATGLGALGLLGWRRKRKTAAITAA
jgi:hypothetical protein